MTKQQDYCPPHASSNDPNTTIKQALAVAIVRHKRQANQEADEWRAKAQRLEAQLQEQAAGNAALREWATSLFNSHSRTEAMMQPRQQRSGFLQDSISGKQEGFEAATAPASAGIFLPPLTLPTSAAAAAAQLEGFDACKPTAGAPALLDSYQDLQQQLLLAAQASSASSAASSVLSGKAASLSDMLLTNMRMLLRLQQLGSTADPSAAVNAAVAAPTALSGMRGSLQESWPTETVATLSTFITGTLLQVPSSSLQRAYMQQCAALLAALLAHLPATPPQQEQQQQPLEQVGRPLQQQLQKQQQASQAGAVAVQAVKLMQQLLAEKMVLKGSSTSHTAASTAAAAAKVMLQQLSTFPSTALLLALAVTQQLQHLMQQLQQVNTAASATQLGRGFSFNQLQQSSKALALAAELFEASHELLEELVRLGCCSRAV
jgi:hypothetical protein